MKARISVALIVVAGVLTATLAILHRPGQNATSEPQQTDNSSTSALPEPPEPQAPKSIATTRAPAPHEAEITILRSPTEASATAVTTNKLERLAQTRESFRVLAAGDRTSAMRVAKQITDVTERETALLALVTESTQGDLLPPQHD